MELVAGAATDIKKALCEAIFDGVCSCVTEDGSADWVALGGDEDAGDLNLGKLVRSRLFSMTSDGASVLLGVESGVGARIRSEEQIPWLTQLHCVCHKLMLAANEAGEKCEVMQYADELLRGVYSLAASSKANRQLEELRVKYDEHQKAVGKLCTTRWLARGNCINAAVARLTSILNFAVVKARLKKRSRDDEDEDGTHTATGTVAHTRVKPARVVELLTKQPGMRYLAALHWLSDMVGQLDDLSTFFQKRGVNLYQALEEVEKVTTSFERNYCSNDHINYGPAMKGFMGRIDGLQSGSETITIKYGEVVISAKRRDFDLFVGRDIREVGRMLEGALRARFPLWRTLRALTIFDVEAAYFQTGSSATYGDADIAHLAEHYKEFIDGEKLKDEWPRVRPLVLKAVQGYVDSKLDPDAGNLMLRRLVAVGGRNHFPASAKLLVGYSTTAPDNTRPESGFSRLAFLKNKYMANLKEQNLNARMVLMEQTPPRGTARVALVQAVATKEFGSASNRAPLRARGARASHKARRETAEKEKAAKGEMKVRKRRGDDNEADERYPMRLEERDWPLTAGYELVDEPPQSTSDLEGRFMLHVMVLDGEETVVLGKFSSTPHSHINTLDAHGGRGEQRKKYTWTPIGGREFFVYDEKDLRLREYKHDWVLVNKVKEHAPTSTRPKADKPKKKKKKKKSKAAK